MHIDERSWFSPALGQDMALKVYGHGGRPVVAFPSQDGRYWDFEAWGMVDACAGFIAAGRMRLIAVDGIDWQSWTNHGIPPADRGRRHDAYDRYLADEVAPFFRELTGWERAWATGASMGGYHAANVVFRHPDLFDGLIAISGLFQLGLFVGDDGTEPVYLNSPLRYLPISTTRGSWTGCGRRSWPSSSARARGRTTCSRTRVRCATCWRPRASRRSSTSGATT
jgi:esterase/lipase superfamily enzyme